MEMFGYRGGIGTFHWLLRKLANGPLKMARADEMNLNDFFRFRRPRSGLARVTWKTGANYLHLSSLSHNPGGMKCDHKGKIVGTCGLPFDDTLILVEAVAEEYVSRERLLRSNIKSYHTF